MPKFCTSCGSPIEENLKFCTKCGGQVGASGEPAPSEPLPTAAPTPTAAPAAVSAAGVAPVAAPAAKAGSPILKIVLIVVGVLVFVGVAGMVTCGYVIWKGKQKLESVVETAKTIPGGEGTPQITQEEGGEGTEAEAAATAEIPVYPNATMAEGGAEFSFGGISSHEYETADAVDQVVAFYKEKLGPKASVQESDGKTIITLMTKSGLNTLTISREAEAEKTKITIARIGK